jgi:hypothetical protein
MASNGSSIHFFITEDDMRSLIKLLFVLVICFVGIGIYQGWFNWSSPNSDPDSNKVNVNVSMDKDKMKSDIKKAEGKVKEEIKKLEGKENAKEAK